MGERTADLERILEPLLGGRKALASLHWRVRHGGEQAPERTEELERFLSKIFDIEDDLKRTSRDIWQMRRFERIEKIRSLKQARRDLAEMAFDDFSQPWMTGVTATIDYWLEVALDLEGVLYAFSNPILASTALALDSFLQPRSAAIAATAARGFGILFFLGAAAAALYFASGTPYWGIGWLLAAYLGWLVYRRARRADKLRRQIDRHGANLSIIDACVSEVQSAYFDAAEIARRLRQCERNGLLVRSAVFTVLQRSAALKSSTAKPRENFVPEAKGSDA